MQYGFVKAAAISPELRLADCAWNAGRIIEALSAASREGVQLACLPELCLTGYTCGDLFLQDSLLQAAEAALEQVVNASRNWNLIALVGLPARVDGKLYNCAAAVLSLIHI